MILKCDCVNSTADILFGRGLRPHAALVKFRDRPTPRHIMAADIEEYSCDYCYYPRTVGQGRITGAKPMLRAAKDWK